MEFTLQKGVEMGVSVFQPLATQRAVVKKNFLATVLTSAWRVGKRLCSRRVNSVARMAFARGAAYFVVVGMAQTASQTTRRRG